MSSVLTGPPRPGEPRPPGIPVDAATATRAATWAACNAAALAAGFPPPIASFLLSGSVNQQYE